MPSSILPRDETGNCTVGQSSREVGAQMSLSAIPVSVNTQLRCLLLLRCRLSIRNGRDGVFDLLDRSRGIACLSLQRNSHIVSIRIKVQWHNVSGP